MIWLFPPYFFASNFHEFIRRIQDLAGGLIVTQPTYKDWQRDDLRPYLERYMGGAGKYNAEERLKLMSMLHHIRCNHDFQRHCFGGLPSAVSARILKELDMFKTEICRTLNIEYPIIQGGMLWVGKADLAAAVSAAGGLGLVSAGAMPIDEIEAETQSLKAQTDKPFGVNVPLQRPDAEAMIDAAIEGGASIIVTSSGSPKRFTALIKARGCKVLHVVSNVAFAQKSAAAGVDAVIAEGYEAGGHNGRDEITTMTLIPQIVAAVDIPVVAAGGIADGRGFIAALALGAQGVQMGTRFLATRESAAHINYKNAVVEIGDQGTCITGRATIGPTRAIKNKLTGMIEAAEQGGATPAELFEMIGEGRSFMASVQGDCDEGSMYCGQIGGHIHELKSAKAVIDDTMAEAKAIVEAFQPLVKT